MGQLKRYYETDEEFGRLHERLKQTRCPHCGRVGCLNLHDVVYGYGEGPGRGRVVRGRRVFCSNRGRRRGCGRTVSILKVHHLRGFIITAVALWRFFAAVAAGVSKRTAFEHLETGLHASNGWRLYRRLARAQSRIRSLLLRHMSVPEPPRSRDPVLATLMHLSACFPNASCPILSFQRHFQTSFL